MQINIKSVIIVSAIAFSLVFALLFKWIQTGNPFRAETIVYASVILLNILITGRIAYLIFKKFSKKSPAQLKESVISAYIVFVIVTLIISLTIVSIGVYTFYLIKGIDTTNFLSQLIRVELAGAIKQFFIWILIGSAFFFYVIWRKTIEREHRLQEENLKYKYRNLKSQVNPHFLFNSLNTLSEIFHQDIDKADLYIQNLSGIYRYIIENEEVDLIPLNEEIEFVKQYFTLQKERDNDKILLKIDFQDAEIFKIVPVSLQILVENALKHNSRSKERPLVIHIYNTHGYVVVANNIQKKNHLENTTRTGLLNLKERVKMIMDKEIIVSLENDQFLVKLPVI